MNEEQRKQRDARVAELAEAAVESSEVGGNLTRSEIEDLEAQVRARINLALDEQAKEIAEAIAQECERRAASQAGSNGDRYVVEGLTRGYRTSAEVARIVGRDFGDDR